jgi:hypothetical protein
MARFAVLIEFYPVFVNQNKTADLGVNRHNSLLRPLAPSALSSL